MNIVEYLDDGVLDCLQENHMDVKHRELKMGVTKMHHLSETTHNEIHMRLGREGPEKRREKR
jgi:hypothetical protein